MYKHNTIAETHRKNAHVSFVTLSHNALGIARIICSVEGIDTTSVSARGIGTRLGSVHVTGDVSGVKTYRKRPCLCRQAPHISLQTAVRHALLMPRQSAQTAETICSRNWRVPSCLFIETSTSTGNFPLIAIQFLTASCEKRCTHVEESAETQGASSLRRGGTQWYGLPLASSSRAPCHNCTRKQRYVHTVTDEGGIRVLARSRAVDSCALHVVHCYGRPGCRFPSGVFVHNVRFKLLYLTAVCRVVVTGPRHRC